MNESCPAAKEVVRIFGPNSMCCCLGPLTISPPVKGHYHVWSNTGLIQHGENVCRIFNWKGLTAYNVTSPLNI